MGERFVLEIIQTKESEYKHDTLEQAMQQAQDMADQKMSWEYYPATDVNPQVWWAGSVDLDTDALITVVLERDDWGESQE